MGFPMNGGKMLEDFEYLMGARDKTVLFISMPRELTGEKRETFRKDLLSTRDLLQQKGWNDKALIYSID